MTIYRTNELNDGHVESAFLISSYAQYFFGFKALVAFVLFSAPCLLFKFGLRRFKYKNGDLKAALNHRQPREWLAMERRKLKRGKRVKKKRTQHF